MNAMHLAKTHGMMSVEEVAAYQKVLREHLNVGQPIVVNIGAGFGTSTAAVLEVKSEAFIFSVDKQLARVEIDNVGKCGLDSSRVVRLWGDSAEIGKNFPISIDVLFVDGNHSLQGIQRDIVAWIDKVAPEGIIAFHDYMHPSVPWITSVVDEAMEDKALLLNVERYLALFSKLW